MAGGPCKAHRDAAVDEHGECEGRGAGQGPANMHTLVKSPCTACRPSRASTFVSASLQQWELFIAGGTALHQGSRAMLSPTRMAGLRTDSPRHVLEQTSTTSKHFQSRDLNLKKRKYGLWDRGSGYKLRHGHSNYGGCGNKNTDNPAETHSKEPY